MDNTIEKQGIIFYKVNFSHEKSTLEVKLQTRNQTIERIFKSSFEENDLPTQFRKQLISVEKISQLLYDSENYEVDVIRGQIIFFNSQNLLLSLKKINQNRVERSKEEDDKSSIMDTQHEIMQLQFPVFEEFPPMKEKEDQVSQQIIIFKKQVQKWKKSFQRAMKQAGNEEIDWTVEVNNGKKLKGRYRGEKKGSIPNGLGAFYNPISRSRILGTWNYGRLNGIVHTNYSNGQFKEYEWKNGKIHGNSIKYFIDGGYEFSEWKDGVKDGNLRRKSQLGHIEIDEIYKNNKLIKKLR